MAAEGLTDLPDSCIGFLLGAGPGGTSGPGAAARGWYSRWGRPECPWPTACLLLQYSLRAGLHRLPSLLRGGVTWWLIKGDPGAPVCLILCLHLPAGQLQESYLVFVFQWPHYKKRGGNCAHIKGLS